MFLMFAKAILLYIALQTTKQSHFKYAVKWGVILGCGFALLDLSYTFYSGYPYGALALSVFIYPTVLVGILWTSMCLGGVLQLIICALGAGLMLMGIPFVLGNYLF